MRPHPLPPLSLDEYQNKAIRTDRTRKVGTELDLTVLGLVGESGSLLSEVKKKQRDSRSYLGYEDAVTEEMGDMLWYLAAVAFHQGLKLSGVAASPALHGTALTFAELQPQQNLPLASPSVAFERTLLRLAGSVGRLAEFSAGPSPKHRDTVHILLSEIFNNMVRAANESGVTLEQAAIRSLEKANDRWPADRILPATFDADFPEEERLPRTLEVEIFERTSGNGKTYVVQKCNGLFIGDRLTDNIMSADDYRFHDAFHYSYAAILGWSPVIRALFRLKRKSEARIDEGEDGARAILIEEGIATYVFGHAKNLDFFEGQEPGDLGFSFLKSVKQFVRGYEVESCPLWLWEEAILAGNRAFRYLREHRRGRLVLDLNARSLRVEQLRP
jgi:NTP pyrophosphatase (non-canonical NTP hydrolase)